MAKFTDKISNLINQQAPDFVLADHPQFLSFIKTYYSFMESAELTLTNVELTDGILLETETNQSNNLLLDGTRVDNSRAVIDGGDKVLQEQTTYGKFERNEIITGATTGATATILAEDLSNNRLYISSQNKFKDGEVITGNNSGGRATISNYRPNPVNTIQNLLEFRDPDKVISNFLTKFRNEFLNTLPENLNNSVNKRKLIKNIKSLYRSKGTARGHEIFFKLLFNLNSETSYPKENMLRVSAGKFNTKKILRAIGTVGQTEDLIGRTITGQTSEATAVVENVFKFQIGANEVSEFIINEDTLTGTFQTSEVIQGTLSDESDTFIKATVTGSLSTPSITNDGALHTANESLTITAAGEGGNVTVGTVGTGGITNFVIGAAGSGYAIGDDLTFSAGNAKAKVSVVNGGITLEDGTEANSTSHIVLEDETVKGDPYTGDKIVQEAGSGNEDITDIRIVNQGNNYESLPTVTVSTASGGSGASVFCYGSEIGRVQELKIVEHGNGFEQSPAATLAFNNKIIISDLSGTFTADETITGIDSSSTAVTATFVSLDTDRNLLTVKDSDGNFDTDTTITGSLSSVTATVKFLDNPTATISNNAVVDTDGSYLNEDGFLSETTMKVQDSLYYQDYSYVLKVGRSISDWRDSFKSTMHGAGFYFTGQVDVENQINVKLKSVTGVNSGVEYDGPALIFNTLFSTIFGRRLGTETDSTSLRSSPQAGVDPDFNDSTIENFTANTRDVTLTQRIVLKLSEYKQFPVTIRGNSTKFGIPVAGPTFKSVGDFVLGGNFGNLTQISDLNKLRLGGTFNTSVNGIVNRLSDFDFRLKTAYAIPAEIFQLSEDSFDENQTFFDATDVSFDAV